MFLDHWRWGHDSWRSLSDWHDLESTTREPSGTPMRGLPQVWACWWTVHLKLTQKERPLLKSIWHHLLGQGLELYKKEKANWAHALIHLSSSPSFLIMGTTWPNVSRLCCLAAMTHQALGLWDEIAFPSLNCFFKIITTAKETKKDAAKVSEVTRREHYCIGEQY